MLVVQSGEVGVVAMVLGTVVGSTVGAAFELAGLVDVVDVVGLVGLVVGVVGLTFALGHPEFHYKVLKI